MFTNRHLETVRQALEGKLECIPPHTETLNTQQLAELLIHQLLSVGSSWLIVGPGLQIHADWYMVTYPGQPTQRHPDDGIRLTYFTIPGGPLMNVTLRWQKSDGSPDLEHLLGQTKAFLELRNAVHCESIVS